MKIKRIVCVCLVLVMAFCGFTGCKSKKKAELNILTWEGYFPEELLSSFEKEYDVKINYTNMTSNEEMLSKLENAKGGDYDVILASDYIIKMAIDEGLVSELDMDKLPNYKNISDNYKGYYYDENNKYTVPYAPGIPYIVYNPEKVSIDITGYESLWDASLKGSVCVMDNERVVLGMALKTMGKSFNEEDEGVLLKAADKLYELAPNIRVIDGNYAYRYLIDGEVSVAYLYTSSVILALNENPNLKVVAPKEGLGYGVDALFVPDKAPNKDMAFKFLNYIMDGKNAAAVAEWTCYLNPNEAANEYLSDWYKSAIANMEDDKDKGEFIKDVKPDALDTHTKIWEEFLKKVK